MSTPTIMSSTPNTKSKSSAKKNSKVVTLRLPADMLGRFPDTADQKEDVSTPSAKVAQTPTIVAPESDSADKSSEANSTPRLSATDANSLVPPSAEGGKKKGSPKIGVKRSAPSPSDGGAKQRGRPGPKKKPRLADGSIDRTTEPIAKKGPATGPTPVNTHKLGPKANTGAINAGLRALDRSGKPCRKWERKGFSLKSFTGVGWAIGSWATPQRDGSSFSGDVKSDSSTSGDVKGNIESSAVPSDRSNSGEPAAVQSNGIPSSPAPEIAAIS